MARDSRAHDRVLVVDLLGGLGDLVMVLPAVHALARRHAPVRVLTHAPGDALLRHDPAVAAVEVADRGDERRAVVAALDRHDPDLVVTTTRYGGIAEEIESRRVRCVTNLWRDPPASERVGDRYLRILADEGLVDTAPVDAAPVAPRVHLTGPERERGRRLLAAHLPAGAPVLLVPAAGMAVKVWPHWAALVTRLHRLDRPVAVVGERATAIGPARPLPPTDLRGLAAIFAAAAERDGVLVGPDTGPMRVAAAVGARTVGLFGPTVATRYGLEPPGVDLQGLPDCPHRRPTAITEQVCWWDASCPLSATTPACMTAITVDDVLAALAPTR